MGVILLKIRGKMPAVGSTSHRKMQGTKRRLEHLMRHRGLRSFRNSYRTREVTFSRVEIKETYRINHPLSKSHFFSPRTRGEKLEFLGAIVGIRGPRIYVGPWALSKNSLWSEDR